MATYLCCNLIELDIINNNSDCIQAHKNAIRLPGEFHLMQAADREGEIHRINFRLMTLINSRPKNQAICLSENRLANV